MSSTFLRLSAFLLKTGKRHQFEISRWLPRFSFLKGWLSAITELLQVAGLTGGQGLGGTGLGRIKNAVNTDAHGAFVACVRSGGMS